MNTIYIVLLILIGLISLFSTIRKLEFRKRELLKTKLVFFVIVLFCGLKGYSVGYDTQSYVTLFYRFGSLSFENLIHAVSRYEIGFQIYTWLIYHITQSPTMYFLISYTILFFCVYYWIKENSEEPFISAFSFICLFLPFLLTGFRQGIAMGFTLLAYTYLTKKRWVSFSISVLFGFVFHMTSIVCLAFFSSFMIKKKWIRRIIILFGTIIFYYYRMILFDIFNSVIPIYEKFKIVGGTFPILYFFMLVLIYITAEYFCIKGISESRNNSLMENELNMFSFSLLLLPFVELNGAMMRMVMYASMYAVLLVPRISKSMDSVIRPSVSKYVIHALLVFIFLRMVLFSSSYSYVFFWEA